MGTPFPQAFLEDQRARILILASVWSRLRFLKGPVSLFCNDGADFSRSPWLGGCAYHQDPRAHRGDFSTSLPEKLSTYRRGAGKRKPRLTPGSSTKRPHSAAGCPAEPS